MPTPDDTTHRRPIGVRGHSLSTGLAHALVRIGFSANAISILGLACACAAAACLALTPLARDGSITISTWVLYLLASAFIPLRLLANMLDGLVAIEHARRSPTGELYNEIPDRLADVAVLVAAGYSIGAHPWLGFTAALLALLITYIRALGRSLGFPSDFRGPMAKQQRMVLVSLASLALAARGWTVDRVQMPEPLRSLSLMDATLALIVAGCLVTAWRRTALLSSRLRKNATIARNHDQPPA